MKSCVCVGWQGARAHEKRRQIFPEFAPLDFEVFQRLVKSLSKSVTPSTFNVSHIKSQSTLEWWEW